MAKVIFLSLTMFSKIIRRDIHQHQGAALQDLNYHHSPGFITGSSSSVFSISTIPPCGLLEELRNID